MAHTSPLYEKRIADIPHRMLECIDAIQKKDFEKLQHVSEEDSLDMHRCMETQTPSLQYLSSETHRIIREIESLRKSDHLEVLYTMDAGPTVHLFCTENARKKISDYAEMQKHCAIFTAKIGNGSTITR
jgi:mevalonate pyrophosphate decarboxylase